MTNPVGTKLSRLIRERSYTSGSLKRLERDIASIVSLLAPLLAEHKTLKRKRRKVLSKIAELDTTIQEQSTIEVAEIIARQCTPRLLTSRHGAFNAEMVSLLRDAEKPLMSEQIIAYMAQTFNMPQSTPKEREETRRRVTRRLRELVKKKAVIRLHDPNMNVGGLWKWIGLYASEEPDA